MEVTVKTRRTTVITIDVNSVRLLLIEKFAKGYDASVEFKDDIEDTVYVDAIRITYTEEVVS